MNLATAKLPDYRLDPPDPAPDFESEAERRAEDMSWKDIGAECLTPNDTLYGVPALLDLLEVLLARGRITPKAVLGTLQAARLDYAFQVQLDKLRNE